MSCCGRNPRGVAAKRKYVTASRPPYTSRTRALTRSSPPTARTYPDVASAKPALKARKKRLNSPLSAGPAPRHGPREGRGRRHCPVRRLGEGARQVRGQPLHSAPEQGREENPGQPRPRQREGELR